MGLQAGKKMKKRVAEYTVIWETSPGHMGSLDKVFEALAVNSIKPTHWDVKAVTRDVKDERVMPPDGTQRFTNTCGFCRKIWVSAVKAHLCADCFFNKEDPNEEERKPGDPVLRLAFASASDEVVD